VWLGYKRYERCGCAARCQSRGAQPQPGQRYDAARECEPSRAQRTARCSQSLVCASPLVGHPTFMESRCESAGDQIPVF